MKIYKNSRFSAEDFSENGRCRDTEHERKCECNIIKIYIVTDKDKSNIHKDSENSQKQNEAAKTVITSGAAVENLNSTDTLIDVVTAFNELLDSLRSAGVIETDDSQI